MIDIRNLNIKYISDENKVWAVRDVDLQLEQGKSYGIVGESGSGKTTLAMAALKLLPKNCEINGEIFYKDIDLLEIREDEFKKYRWKDFSVVFQGSMDSFSPVHRLRTQFRDIYHVHYPKKSNDEIDKEVLELFNKFSLPPNAYKSYPHELSGGMIQRVAIVLSLILRPNVLVLDEATTALDLINERQILETIKDIEEEVSLIRINITHDISVVYSSCSDVIVMYAGHLLEKGPTDEVFKSPRHPYTKGLLDSYPDIAKREGEIKGIKGTLPDLTKEYNSCIFYSRCPYRLDKCKNIKPELETEGNRVFKCHNPIGVNYE